MEKISSERLVRLITKHKLFLPNQVAYKNNKNIFDSLFFMDNIATKDLSTRNHNFVISDNFEKTF